MTFGEHQDVDEVGELYMWYRPVQDDWLISLDSKWDVADGGVVFTITSAGQVQYTSDDLAGASYAGELKIVELRKIPV